MGASIRVRSVAHDLLNVIYSEGRRPAGAARLDSVTTSGTPIPGTALGA
ncbi:hypothetical protein [Actinomadura sp. 9N407]